VKWDSLSWLRAETTVLNSAAYLNARKTRLTPNPAGGKNGPPAKAGQVILQCFLLHLKHGLAVKQFPARKISFLARKTLELSQWQWTNA
jgi:hypothetical protein